MKRIIIFTDEEAEKLCYDKIVTMSDERGVTTLYMNETRYKQFVADKYLGDDDE